MKKKIIIALLWIISGLFIYQNVKAAEVKIVQKVKFNGQVTLKYGGWSSYEVFTNESESQFYMCMDPTLQMYDGYFTSNPFTGTIDHLYNQTPSKLTSELENELALISYFGYQENFSYKRVVYTQHLHWETLNPNFAPVRYTGELSMTEYLKHKEEVLNKVKQYKTLPSFDNQVFDIKRNQNFKLDDTNQVLQTLDIQNNQDFEFSIEGNTLNVVAKSDSANFVFKKKINPKFNYPSLLYKKAGSQTLSLLGINDPIRSNVGFNVNGNTKLLIQKTDENSIPIGQVEFEIGLTPNLDTIINTVVTDSEGKANLDLNLAEQTVYIREKLVPAPYVKSDEIKAITLKYDVVNQVHFINRIKKGSIEILKLNAHDDKVLKEVEFGLFQNDTLIQKVITDENGKALFNEVPFGNYVIRELTQLEGYIQNNEIVPVAITDDKQVITLSIKNEKVPLIWTKVLNEEVVSDIKSIVDQVIVKDIIPSTDYELKAYLVDKETQLILQESIVTKTVNSTHNETEVEVIFDLDLSQYVDKNLVVFEELYRDGKLVSEHKDLNNAYQSFNVLGYTQLSINKIDSITKQPIKRNVKFGLFLDNHLIQTQSSDSGEVIFEKLIEGKTYTAKELDAPVGYIKSDEVIEIKANGQRISVEYQNTLLPAIKKEVKTGHFDVSLSLMIGSGLILFKLKKSKNK